VARKWNPALHPRDHRGRFTRSASRVMTAGDRKRGRNALQGFRPAEITDAAAAKSWLQGKGKTPTGAVAKYLTNDWKTTNAALRAGKTADGVDDIDAAMTGLPEDVVLRRHMPLALFAHIPMKDLEGMKVRDAAYASTTLDVPGDGEGRPGLVTMHIAAPAGTKEIVIG
jgi:hypothetical protein